MSKLLVMLNCAFASVNGTEYEAGQTAELNYSEATRLVNSGGAVVLRFADEAEVSADVADVAEVSADKRMTKEDKASAAVSE